MKHTQGPWKVVVTKKSIEIQTEGRNDWPIIAEILAHDEIGSVGNPVENVANAHLIATAPDLLEAGKSAVILLEKYIPKKYLVIGLENLKQAIAKAEGGLKNVSTK
jgi:hypothetical protein